MNFHCWLTSSWAIREFQSHPALGSLAWWKSLWSFSNTSERNTREFECTLMLCLHPGLSIGCFEGIWSAWGASSASLPTRPVLACLSKSCSYPYSGCCLNCSPGFLTVEELVSLTGWCNCYAEASGTMCWTYLRTRRCTWAAASLGRLRHRCTEDRSSAVPAGVGSWGVA